MEIKDKYLIKQIEKDVAKLTEALEIAKISGTSDMVEEYEVELAKQFGSKYAIAVSSGTAALNASLYIAGVRPGDEVVIPATSTLPTAMPVLTMGATPVIVDTEKDGLGLDINDLKRKVTSKTKAVIQLPLWGYPIDYSEALEFCNANKLAMIEDAAQAHGAKKDGKYIGTFGDFGCFSTHDRKILSTGEGGFILTDNKNLAEQIKQYTQLGYMNGTDYGVNYKMSTLQTAVGLARMHQVDDQVKKRNETVTRILKGLSETSIRTLPVSEGDTPNYYSLLLLLPWELSKNRDFISEVADLGIGSDITNYKYCPIYERPLFSEYKSACPNTEEMINSMTTVPIRPNFSEEEIEYIIETYLTTFDKYNLETK